MLLELRYCFQESQTNGRRKRFTPKRPTAWRGPRGAKRTTGSRFWPHAPWRTFRLDPEHLGVRPARGTRVELFCRRSRSTSITFPGEPRAITRAAGRVQGPRYRAARSRSRRCVIGISDKSTRNSALPRAFSARNASSFVPIVNCGKRSITFQRHFFRVLARDLKPGAHFGALAVSVGEFIDPFFASVRFMGASRDGPNTGCFSGQNIGPLPVVD